MKIAVASGKGGVGKSMLCSSLTLLFAQKQKVTVVDCDVDAPNLHLWLGGIDKWDKVEKISVSEKPIINQKKCTKCGKCVDICAFGALKTNHLSLILNSFFCEGCGACEAICPVGAITMKPIFNAEIKTKLFNYSGNRIIPIISAQLYPGETGSGKIVDHIKQKAEEFEYQTIILDSPAGIGCPVIAALNGIDFVVLITEPTPSGFTDLKRVLQVVDHFKIPFGVIINKWDINKKESDRIVKWSGNKLLGKISYDKKIFKAISNLTPILKTNLKAKKEIEEIFKKLRRLVLHSTSLPSFWSETK